jgi:putative chitinase
MNRAKFYAELRKASSGVFGTSMSQRQVAGIDAILDEAEKRRTPLKHLAYILATPYLETGAKYQPIRENLNYSVQALIKKFGRHRISVAEAEKYGRKGGRPADQRAIANTIYGGEWGRDNLGNTEPDDGWLFRGGGLAQITGRTNFTKFGMASDPDRSGDLIPSVRMMFDGMEAGLFTGKSLDDFTTYLPMRQIINSMDRAEDVAGYAQSFEAALKIAGYTAERPPRPTPTKTTTKPVPAPSGGWLGALLAMLAAIFGSKKK